MHKFPVQTIYAGSLPGASMDINLAGRSGALWSMWRSPNANTKTMPTLINTPNSPKISNCYFLQGQRDAAAYTKNKYTGKKKKTFSLNHDDEDKDTGWSCNENRKGDCRERETVITTQRLTSRASSKMAVVEIQFTPCSSLYSLKYSM